jgi:hypothetical protein
MSFSLPDLPLIWSDDRSGYRSAFRSLESYFGFSQGVLPIRKFLVGEFALISFQKFEGALEVPGVISDNSFHCNALPGNQSRRNGYFEFRADKNVSNFHNSAPWAHQLESFGKGSRDAGYFKHHIGAITLGYLLKISA